jgi:hypothetical protein
VTTSYSSPNRTKLPVGTVDASVARTLARGGWRVRVRRACISCLSVDETGAAGARRGAAGGPGPCGAGMGAGDRGPVPPPAPAGRARRAPRRSFLILLLPYSWKLSIDTTAPCNSDTVHFQSLYLYLRTVPV